MISKLHRLDQEHSEQMRSGASRVNAQLGTVFVPRRYRAVHELASRPASDRYSRVGLIEPNLLTEQERVKEKLTFQTVYREFANMCALRVPPLQYGPLCNRVLQTYSLVTEGIHYGDRPDEICFRMDQCKRNSYIRSGPHTNPDFSDFPLPDDADGDYVGGMAYGREHFGHWPQWGKKEGKWTSNPWDTDPKYVRGTSWLGKFRSPFRRAKKEG